MPFARWWSLLQFVRGVRTELTKVAWPTSGETRRVSLLVLAIVVAFALNFLVLDAVVHQTFGWLIRTN